MLCPGPINTNIVDSQRNRDPASTAGNVGTEAGDKFWDLLTRSLAEGMGPDEVGPMILDAIVNDKFWVLTHPGLVSIVDKQLDWLRSNQSLTR